MAMELTSFFTVPLRHWKSFLPLWLCLAIGPYAMLAAANTDRLPTYFWFAIAPVLALAFWPVVRLGVQREINILERFVWIIVPTLFAHALFASVYQALRFIGL